MAMRNLYGLMALIMGWGGMYGITHEQGAIGLLLMVAMGISIYKGQLPQSVVRKLDVSQLAAAQAVSLTSCEIKRLGSKCLSYISLEM